jgi:hypothetical protein
VAGTDTAALVAGTGAGAVVWTALDDGAAVVGDGDGRGAARVALWAAGDVARGDGVPFVVPAWAATLTNSSNKAIPPSAVSTLCRRTHNIHGAGLRGA